MILDLPAAWVSDVNVPLSATDLDILRDNTIMLDGLCYRRMNVTNSSGSQLAGDAADWHSKGDYRQSWWGLRFTTGMTTLTILGECATQIDIYINGVLSTTQAASASFTKTITPLIGFTDGDIILIEILTNGNPNPSTGTTGYTNKYVIYDIYGSPVVTTSTWPGVPTFAGTYSAALLNQLRDAMQYIWDRVVAIPIIPNCAYIYARGSHKAETIRLFDGAVGRYASNEVLRIVGTLTSANDAEHYEIDYNGSTSVTSATYSAGDTVTFSHPIALTHTIGTRVPIRIRQVVTSDTTTINVPEASSLYRLLAMRSEADGTGYASATPPTVFTAEESISAATLNSRLNALSTILSAAKARLDARADQWNRARAFRRVFAKDETQVNRNMKRHAAQFQRQGDMLIVRGKGVKVAWGALVVDPAGEEDGIPKPIDYTKFSWANEVSVGAEDKIETTILPLANFQGLEIGMLYFVYSQTLEFAAEYLNDPT